MLSSNISSTCPHNMVNFGPLAAEILLLVWGTPDNFNGFHAFAALLYGTLVVGVSQTAALNRGRHLYSAGRPSRWAFAHISSVVCCSYGNINSKCVMMYLCTGSEMCLLRTYHSCILVYGMPADGCYFYLTYCSHDLAWSHGFTGA